MARRNDDRATKVEVELAPEAAVPAREKTPGHAKEAAAEKAPVVELPTEERVAEEVEALKDKFDFDKEVNWERVMHALQTREKLFLVESRALDKLMPALDDRAAQAETAMQKEKTELMSDAKKIIGALPERLRSVMRDPLQYAEGRPIIEYLEDALADLMSDTVQSFEYAAERPSSTVKILREAITDRAERLQQKERAKKYSVMDVLTLKPMRDSFKEKEDKDFQSLKTYVHETVNMLGLEWEDANTTEDLLEFYTSAIRRESDKAEDASTELITIANKLKGRRLQWAPLVRFLKRPTGTVSRETQPRAAAM